MHPVLVLSVHDAAPHTPLIRCVISPAASKTILGRSRVATVTVRVDVAPRPPRAPTSTAASTSTWLPYGETGETCQSKPSAYEVPPNDQ